jgi:large subunit ribosomal protein L6
MSRIANKPVAIPQGVEVNQVDQVLTVKGGLGEMSLTVHPNVKLEIADGTIKFAPVEASNIDSRKATALAGTMRSLTSNIVLGVSEGFTRKLELVGVGYRAAAQGKVLNLTLGFSHPVNYEVPEGITVETPSQTEIIVRGYDRQLLGQVCAEIRAYRPPEPYKGKGIRYSDEVVIRKEAKKK